MISYKISAEDYVSALKLHHTPTRKAAVLLAILFLVFLVTAIFSYTSVLKGLSIGAILGGVITFFLSRFVFIPFIGRRDYNAYKLMQQDHRVDIVDEGLIFSTASGSGNLLWDKIYKWRQSDDYILIYPMPRLYYIVPKRLEQDGFDIQKLVEKLNSCVGKRQ